MKKVVACGVSGLIGRPLCADLRKSYSLVRLVRHEPSAVSDGNEREIFWDPPNLGSWIHELEGAYGVINLSGEGIAEGRWTAERKKALRHSRLDTTKAVVEAIARTKERPKVLLNASAIGFYGPREDKPLDESALRGEGFLPELCAEWEKEAMRAQALGVRVVCLRTGIVLAKEGGALKKMLLPFKMFIGGVLGSGRQIMSWIHLEDEIGAILKALEDSNLSGALNLTAPTPVSMKEFAETLGAVLHRPSVLPVPGFALKRIFGEMADMLLTGQNVIPKKLADSDFRFKFEQLGPALQNLLNP